MIETAQSISTGFPRLGFLGTGWIGRHRLQRIAESGAAEISVICDPSPEVLAETRKAVPRAAVASCFDDLLAAPLDAVVIATPSALHAEQSIAALDRGLAVFCQKPLGRTAAEVAAVLDAAERNNRLLGVDLSYRFTEAMVKIRDLIRQGEIGDVYACELVFHNAYGPDKPWFYDPQLAGGGCVMDLGVHLVDLALWTLEFPAVEHVSSRLYSKGELLAPSPSVVEDFATARLDLEGGITAQMACSWNLSAGRDCVLTAEFHGTRGGLSMKNEHGSFYDFRAELYHGTSRRVLSTPPDAWGGRAAVAWAEQLARGSGFDPSVRRLLDVHRALDAIYGRASISSELAA